MSDSSICATPEEARAKWFDKQKVKLEQRFSAAKIIAEKVCPQASPVAAAILTLAFYLQEIE